MFPSAKTILLTAASVSLALTHTATADDRGGDKPRANPYVAGDMHNHNTCTDGSVSAGYAIDRSVATGVTAGGGTNFDLDWFTLGNHGGAGNRDCRFSDNSANLPGDPTTTWSQTLGQTIDGITITSLKGTPNGTGSSATMWRWQSIKEVEYPIIVNRTPIYNKVLVEGLEWIVPGHEHTDVAVITGQNPRGHGNADKMAEYEFRFDRADIVAIGLLDGENGQVWPGKDNVNNSDTAGHQKAVSGVTWLQAHYPLQSYAIPTHTERAGVFNPTGSHGYTIEHFRDFNNAGPTVAFIPGEYTKLYVPNSEHFRAQSIVDGMRSGNSYSVNADIIGPDLVFRARGRDDDWKTMGETLVVRPGEKITVEMTMTVPAKNNSPYSFNNPLLQQVGIHQPLNKPSLDHVDLITGRIAGVIPPGSPGYAVANAGGVAGASIVYNPTTTISQQIHANNMRSKRLRDGSTQLTFTTTFTAGTTPSYVRARGTNIPVATPNVTDSAGSPLLDVNNALVSCTDPACPTHLAAVNGVKKVTFDVQAYSNVWFYANPIFIRPEGSSKLLVEKNADLARRLAERADNDHDGHGHDHDHDRHDHDGH